MKKNNCREGKWVRVQAVRSYSHRNSISLSLSLSFFPSWRSYVCPKGKSEGLHHMGELYGKTHLQNLHKISKLQSLLSLQACLGTVACSLSQLLDSLLSPGDHSKSLTIALLRFGSPIWWDWYFNNLPLPSYHSPDFDPLGRIPLSSRDFISVNWGLHL